MQPDDRPAAVCGARGADAQALARATTLRRRALGLAAADARAFGAVTDAYRLPKETDEQARARAEQIQEALIGATEVPLETAALAGEVVQLAGRIVDGANVNALADIAATVAAARAALETALVNVEADLAALPDRSRGGNWGSGQPAWRRSGPKPSGPSSAFAASWPPRARAPGSGRGGARKPSPVPHASH